MFTITLTRQQLYELYYQGPRPTLNLIEQLFETLADWERILGAQKPRAIDSLEGTVRRLTAHVERLKEQLCKEQGLNYQLTSRLQELQVELARRDEPGGALFDAAQVRRDSHNSSLPPSIDLPAAKAANSIKRTRSLRRRTGRRVGGQPGHRGMTQRAS